MVVATRALRISSDRGLGAIDGVDEHGEAGQRSRGRLRDVATARIVLLLLEELVGLPDEWLLGLEIEGEERAREVPLDVVLHLLYERGIDSPRVLGDEHLGRIVERLGREAAHGGGATGAADTTRAETRGPGRVTVTAAFGGALFSEVTRRITSSKSAAS